jgi:hypothetical protein
MMTMMITMMTKSVKWIVFIYKNKSFVIFFKKQQILKIHILQYRVIKNIVKRKFHILLIDGLLVLVAVVVVFSVIEDEFDYVRVLKHQLWSLKEKVGVFQWRQIRTRKISKIMGFNRAEKYVQYTNLCLCNSELSTLLHIYIYYLLSSIFFFFLSLQIKQYCGIHLFKEKIRFFDRIW